MKLAYRSLANLLKGLVLVSALANAPAALADPPDWAPANGYRDHQDHEGNHGDDEDEHHGKDHPGHGYRGYDDRDWHSDYGIVTGHCDRAAVGTVLGGVVGGVIGSSVGSPQNREVAIIVGAVVGSVIGHEIGQDMDRADRGCIGHALELAHDGQSVQWRNAQRGIDYRVTPVGPWTRGGSDCRQFKVRVQKGGRAETQTGHACRSGDGEWRMT
jgi:surface antigen